MVQLHFGDWNNFKKRFWAAIPQGILQWSPFLVFFWQWPLLTIKQLQKTIIHNSQCADFEISNKPIKHTRRFQLLAALHYHKTLFDKDFIFCNSGDCAFVPVKNKSCCFWSPLLKVLLYNELLLCWLKTYSCIHPEKSKSTGTLKRGCLQSLTFWLLILVLLMLLLVS